MLLNLLVVFSVILLACMLISGLTDNAVLFTTFSILTVSSSLAALYLTCRGLTMGEGGNRQKPQSSKKQNN